jgi:uncharacterized protein YuzE
MLYAIKSENDQYINLLTEDPVRPSIPILNRIGNNRDIFVYRDDVGNVKAITCVSYQDFVPMSESELFVPSSEPNIAVFYTIWSYAAGAGRKLIFNALKHLKENNPNITRFVTLSPPTEMARKFHINNGAVVFRDNVQTVNYEYY